MDVRTGLADDAAAVDPTVLDTLVAGFGPAGAETRRMLIDTYLKDGRPRITEIEQAHAAGDSTAVARTAHTMRSGSAQLGAGPLAALLMDLELAALAGPSPAGVVLRVSAEYDRVEAAFEHMRTDGTGVQAPPDR